MLNVFSPNFLSYFFLQQKSNQLCKVCGDDAEGYSYGVITCYSCRIFFCVTSVVKVKIFMNFIIYFSLWIMKIKSGDKV